ncbi:MAG TPA: tripartite tricarboxylate transporter TctB family protein [Clostridiaceae bacterium]|nr:tripartite tricarboxylate transporter TctB family protein [Clostridiaceae bacterium]
MKRANLIIAGLLAMLGAYVLYLSNQLPDFANQNTTGPAFFPVLLVILLFGLLVLLVGTTLKNETNRPVGILTGEATKSFITMGIILVYLLVFNILGFLVSTVLFLFIVISYLSPKRNYLKSALISVLATSMIYVVFRIVLLVPIPSGMFIG